MNHIQDVEAFVPLSRIPLLKERLNRINDLLVKAGCPQLSITMSEPAVTTHSVGNVSGVNLSTVKVVISRDVNARIGKVTLLGKTEIDPGSSFMSHKFFTEINEEQLAAFEQPKHICHCDHCGTQRKRSIVYLFQTPSGISRVGSGCADDFAGMHIKKWLIAMDDAVIELAKARQLTIGQIEDIAIFKVDDFLDRSIHIIDTMGYHSSRDYGANSTARAVYDLMMMDNDLPQEQRWKPSPEIVARREEIKAYIQASVYRPEDANKDYFVNLRNLLEFGYNTLNQAGLIASSVQAYAGYQSKLKAEADNINVGTKHLGAVKERAVFRNLKVISVFHDQYQNAYGGAMTKYTFMDPDKNIITWRRSGYYEAEIGQEFNIIGKVSNHTSWYSKRFGKTVNCTEISYCKVATEEEILKFKQGEEAKTKKKKGPDKEAIAVGM